MPKDAKVDTPDERRANPRPMHRETTLPLTDEQFSRWRQAARDLAWSPEGRLYDFAPWQPLELIAATGMHPCVLQDLEKYRLKVEVRGPRMFAVWGSSGKLGGSVT